MPGVTFGIYLFLLQAQISYFKEDDPMQVRILVIAIAVIVVTALVFKLVRGGGKKTVVGKTTSYAAPKRFNPFRFRRAAAPYGLSGEQKKLLEYVFRNDNVTDPVRVMKDSAVLDRHFKHAFKTIARDSGGTERTQQYISKLFLLRNAIEAAPVEDDTSSSMPVVNTDAIIKYGIDNYNVRIYFSNNRNIITEVPRNSLGTSLKVSNGTSVNLTYLSRSNNCYSLICNYDGIEKTESGPGFRMNSSGSPRPLTKRQTRRRQVDIRCEFYFVQVFEKGKGRNKTIRQVVSPKRFTGDIRDISAGGCSIRTPVPVQTSSRLKINCYLSFKEQISVLGLVIRSNHSSAGTVIHVKFLKVPLRAYNAINTLVFGFNENPEKDRTGA